VLSHERAGGRELEPYAASVFSPMPVVVLTGRCASVEPPCSKEHAVWYGWRDAAGRNWCAACDWLKLPTEFLNSRRELF
jgi:hypothetical protein